MIDLTVIDINFCGLVCLNAFKGNVLILGSNAFIHTVILYSAIVFGLSMNLSGVLKIV